MFKKGFSKTIAVVAVGACLLALVPVGAVHAADFSHDGIVNSGETIQDDVFLSGEHCRMDGVVDGNLVAGCQSIEVAGTVTGDALLFAETITVGDGAVIEGNLFAFAANMEMNGTVSGSFVSAAATITLEKNAIIARNAYFAGYQGKMEQGAQIGMDVFGGANQIIMNGEIARDLTVGVNALEMSGSVGRNAKVSLGTNSDDLTNYSVYSPHMQYFPESLPAGIRLSDGAQVGGDLTYESVSNVDSQLEKYVAGDVIYNQIVESGSDSGQGRNFVTNLWNQQNSPQSRVTRAFRQLITYFAIGALAFWLWKKQATTVRDRGFALPGKAFGWGFVAILVGGLSLILVPITFVLLGILVGVISLGGLLFTWYGVLGLAILLIFAIFLFVIGTLSKVVSAYVFGYWLMKDVFKSQTQNRWIDLLVGVLFYVLLRAIPYIGWIIALAATLYGTGALFISFSKVEKRKESQAVEEK